MALPRIIRQDVQQMPDDGKRREAIGGEVMDEIDLAEVFRRA